MNVSGSKSATAATLCDGLGTVKPTCRPGARAVPEKPTMEMLAAGSVAGGVSVETAWNIFQAMLKAAG